MKRKKRVWTDEQKAAAADRMRAAQKVRWEKVREQAAQVAQMTPSEMQDGLNAARAEKTDSLNASIAVMEKPARDPEVQAVLDSMTDERKAKLAGIQARMLSSRDGQAAIARHEAEKVEAAVVVAELPPSRIGSREVSLIVRTDGTMVSQYGPCVCGAAKREWHTICLKQ